MYPILEVAHLVKQWTGLLNAYLRCLRHRTVLQEAIPALNQWPIYSTLFSRTGRYGSRNRSLEVGFAPLISLLVSNRVIGFDDSVTLSFVKLEVIFFSGSNTSARRHSTYYTELEAAATIYLDIVSQ